MLDRARRLTTADEYRATLRRGRRRAGGLIVVSVAPGRAAAPPRFGFVVSRQVGNAVVRNRVRRRLKAIAHELSASVPSGTDVVVRALPASATAGYGELADEFRSAL